MSRGEGKEMKQTGLECQSDLLTHVSCLRGLCKGYMLAMSALTNFAESLGLLDWIHTSCDDISLLSGEKTNCAKGSWILEERSHNRPLDFQKKKHIFEDWLFELPLF